MGLRRCASHSAWLDDGRASRGVDRGNRQTLEIPNPKSQAPIPKMRVGIYWDLELGTWDLPAARLRSVARHHDFLGRLRPDRRVREHLRAKRVTARGQILELDGVKALLLRAGQLNLGRAEHRVAVSLYPERSVLGVRFDRDDQLHGGGFGVEMAGEPDFDVVFRRARGAGERHQRDYECGPADDVSSHGNQPLVRPSATCVPAYC